MANKIDNKWNLNITEKMAKLETDVTHIKQSINDVKKSIDNAYCKLDAFVEAIDSKYAKKNVELIVDKHDRAINEINLTIAKWVGFAIAISTMLSMLLQLL